MSQRRIAILIELPEGDADYTGLRRFLKILLRAYGLRCLAITPPAETQTFGSHQPTDQENQPNVPDDQ